MLKLTKTVPARIETFEAYACRLDFLTMCQRFRDIRGGSRHQMNSCHWCRHKFEDGEMMTLALSKQGNKALCRSCGEKLIASGTDSTGG